MRKHAHLEELIAKETDHPNPRHAAGQIQAKAPADATDAVMYKDKEGHWLILFVPGQIGRSVPQAGRTRVDQKRAVASCPVTGRPL